MIGSVNVQYHLISSLKIAPLVVTVLHRLRKKDDFFAALILLEHVLASGLLPESPRWLLGHNKPKKAMEELTKVAEFNRKVMPAGELEEKDTNSTQRQGDFRDLFSSKEMTKRTLISGFAW